MEVRIKSLKIGENPLDFRGSKDAWLEELGARVAQQGEVTPGELHFSGILTKIDPDCYLKGRLQFQSERICSRCAEGFPQPVDHSFELALVRVPKGQKAGRELEKGGAADVSYFEEDVIELVPIVEEQFFLSLPYQALCKKDCKGICQTCGKNRNEAPCSCPQETSVMAFSVLKQCKV